jgi:TIR domain-containing protein
MSSQASVFISYRRSDSADVCGRANEALTAAFGRHAIFRDIGSIPVGARFCSEIGDTLAKCKAVLVMIGPQWVGARDVDGNWRLENPADLVRIEIETALQNPRLRVIPVLINNAPMPGVAELPLSLRALRDLNAASLRQDPDFHHDIAHLIAELSTLGVPRVALPVHPTAPISKSTTIISHGPNAKIVSVAKIVNFNE